MPEAGAVLSNFHTKSTICSVFKLSYHTWAPVNGYRLIIFQFFRILLIFMTSLLNNRPYKIIIISAESFVIVRTRQVDVLMWKN